MTFNVFLSCLARFLEHWAYNRHCVCACVVGREKPPKFIAGIIVARKDSAFLRLWYESYRNNYQEASWDYNCAVVPYQLYLRRPNLLHVEPYKFTTPDWTERYKLWSRVIDWRNLYVIHIMMHLMRDTFTPDSIKVVDSTFGEVMRYIYYGSPRLIMPSPTPSTVRSPK